MRSTTTSAPRPSVSSITRSKMSSLVWSRGGGAERLAEPALSGPPATASTRAPAATPSWIIAVPTAVAPPTTSSVSPGGQVGSAVEREVASVERQRERGGLDVVELGRRVEDAGGRGEGGLGDAAERLVGHGHDAATEPVLGAFAGRVDDAAHVHAEREGDLAHDARDGAAAAGDVPEVQRRGRTRDAHLARAGLGHRDVLDLERLPGAPWRTTRTAFTATPPSAAARHGPGSVISAPA